MISLKSCKILHKYCAILLFSKQIASVNLKTGKSLQITFSKFHSNNKIERGWGGWSLMDNLALFSSSPLSGSELLCGAINGTDATERSSKWHVIVNALVKNVMRTLLAEFNQEFRFSI